MVLLVSALSPKSRILSLTLKIWSFGPGLGHEPQVLGAVFGFEDLVLGPPGFVFVLEPQVLGPVLGLADLVLDPWLWS